MKQRKKIVERISLEEKENLLTNFVPFLSKGKFVNVATCSMERMPNVAPKLIVRQEKNILYLIDYVMGTTCSNLNDNPRVSVSFFDDKTLTGYQLNGTVTIIESGKEYDEFFEEFQQIKTNFTVERILLDIREGKKADPPELFLPEKFAVFKVKVYEVVEIASSGGLRSKVVL